MAMRIRPKASLAILLFLSIVSHAARVSAQDAATPQDTAMPQDTGYGIPLSQGNGPGGPPEKFSYGGDVGVGETDNVTLASANKTSQTLAIADADVDVLEQRRLFSVDAKGNFSYLDFLQGAYSPELIGRFDGIGKVSLIPEKVIWVLQEDFGQAQIDPFAPVTPTNQQNINYVSTGPDVNLRLGSLGFADLTARYARTTYQDSPFDSDKLLATLAVGRAISSGAIASVNASVQRTLFDNTAVNGDFTRASLFGDYEAKGARTELSVNLGVTKLTQSAESATEGSESVTEGPESLTGPYAKLKLSRRLSQAMKLTFTAGRDITDASTAFSGLQSGAVSTIGTVQTVGSSGAVGTAPAPQTSANYTVTYGMLNWDYAFSRTTIGVSGQWERDSYDGQPALDLERATGQFTITRKLTARFTAQVLASVYRTEYSHVDYAETNALAGLLLSYQGPRGLLVRLRADHVSQIASGSEVGAVNYAENRVFLTVGYQSAKANVPY
jgi:hypothetical protein